MSSSIPIVASADDLKSAIRFAERNPSSRHYVTKRAIALDAADQIPDEWGMAPLVAASARGASRRVGKMIGDLWDASLHPRGRDGQFIEKGGSVNVYEGRGYDKPSGRGKAVGVEKDSNGQTLVTVEMDGGGQIHVDPAMLDSAPAAKARLGDDDEFVPIGDTVGEDEERPSLGEPGSDVSNPIDCGDDIVKASKLLVDGKSVRLNQPDQVATLLDELAREVNERRAAGENPPDVDLCNVSVPGTNLFCVDNIGIPRAQMPQLKGLADDNTLAATKRKDVNDPESEANIEPEFRAELERRGISITPTTVKASHLRASQSQLDGPKVVGMAGAMEEGKIPDSPIFVTRDGYILDGHHRWAAKVAIDLKDGQLGDIDMPVEVLDMEIGEAIDFANEFGKSQGLRQKGLGKEAEGVKAEVPGDAMDQAAINAFIDDLSLEEWEAGLDEGEPRDTLDRAKAIAESVRSGEMSPFDGIEALTDTNAEDGFDYEDARDFTQSVVMARIQADPSIDMSDPESVRKGIIEDYFGGYTPEDIESEIGSTDPSLDDLAKFFEENFGDGDYDSDGTARAYQAIALDAMEQRPNLGEPSASDNGGLDAEDLPLGYVDVRVGDALIDYQHGQIEKDQMQQAVYDALMDKIESGNDADFLDEIEKLDRRSFVRIDDAKADFENGQISEEQMKDEIRDAVDITLEKTGVEQNTGEGLGEPGSSADAPEVDPYDAAMNITDPALEGRDLDEVYGGLNRFIADTESAMENVDSIDTADRARLAEVYDEVASQFEQWTDGVDEYAEDGMDPDLIDAARQGALQASEAASRYADRLRSAVPSADTPTPPSDSFGSRDDAPSGVSNPSAPHFVVPAGDRMTIQQEDVPALRDLVDNGGLLDTVDEQYADDVQKNLDQLGGDINNLDVALNGGYADEILDAYNLVSESMDQLVTSVGGEADDEEGPIDSLLNMQGTIAERVRALTRDYNDSDLFPQDKPSLGEPGGAATFDEKYDMERSAIQNTLTNNKYAKLRLALARKDWDAIETALTDLQLDGDDSPAFRDAFERIERLRKSRPEGESKPDLGNPSGAVEDGLRKVRDAGQALGFDTSEIDAEIPDEPAKVSIGNDRVPTPVRSDVPTADVLRTLTKRKLFLNQVPDEAERARLEQQLEDIISNPSHFDAQKELSKLLTRIKAGGRQRKQYRDALTEHHTSQGKTIPTKDGRLPDPPERLTTPTKLSTGETLDSLPADTNIYSVSTPGLRYNKNADGTWSDTSGRAVGAHQIDAADFRTVSQGKPETQEEGYRPGRTRDDAKSDLADSIRQQGAYYTPEELLGMRIEGVKRDLADPDEMYVTVKPPSGSEISITKQDARLILEPMKQFDLGSPSGDIPTSPNVDGNGKVIGKIDRVRAAEEMYGTGSKQHKAAIAKWGRPDNPRG